MPEKFSQMSVGATETEEDAKKRQKRGGKGMMKVSEKKFREMLKNTITTFYAKINKFS